MPSRTTRYSVTALAVLAIVTACSREPAAETSSLASAETSLGPIATCVHMRVPYTDYDCPEDAGGAALAFVELSSGDSVTLVIRKSTGATYVTPITPNADVIFLTKMATDSILVRYYQTIGDTAKANALRAELRARGGP